MCSHHWMISSSNQGVCKLCGDVRDFQSALYKSKGYNDKLTPFGKRIIMTMRLNVANDYYLQGHLDKGLF